MRPGKPVPASRSGRRRACRMALPIAHRSDWCCWLGSHPGNDGSERLAHMSRRKERVGREQELRVLADDPAAQTALALSIVARDRDTLNLRAALAVLQAHPVGQAR